MSSTLNRPTHVPAPLRRVAALERRTDDELTLESTVVRYHAGHGVNSHISLQWQRNLYPKDATTQTLTPFFKPMGLTKEEVRGSKVERDICLPPTCEGGELLPGGLIDSLKLLSTGRFHYLLPGQRCPYSITITPDPTSRTAPHPASNPPFTLAAGGDLSPAATLAELEALKQARSPGGLGGITPPKRSSSTEMRWSTFAEGMALHVGGSSFPMAPSSANPFSFSAERYRHLYVYSFEQVVFSASAPPPAAASDLFRDGEEPQRHVLFIENVKFGRRLYVIVESEYALETCANLSRGSLEWIVLSAKLQREDIAAQVRKHLSIRLLSQDGWIQQIHDYTTLNSAIDSYFQAANTATSLSPLAYQVCDLQGAPVSLVTTAWLDGQQCLTSPKARVHLKSITLRGSSPRKSRAGGAASAGPREIHGSVNLHVVDDQAGPVAGQGRTMDSGEQPGRVSSGSITLASKEAPLIIQEGQPLDVPLNGLDGTVDIDLTSLDMTLDMEPFIETSPHQGQDRWMSRQTPRQTLRQLVLQGATGTTFQFHKGHCQLDLTVEIQPL